MKTNSDLATELASMASDGTIARSGKLPSRGYFVAVDDGAIVGQTVDASMLSQAVEQLVIRKGSAPFYGRWTSDGKIYLDAVWHFASRRDAITAGRMANQQAIWDIERSEEITV